MRDLISKTQEFNTKYLAKIIERQQSQGMFKSFLEKFKGGESERRSKAGRSSGVPQQQIIDDGGPGDRKLEQPMAEGADRFASGGGDDSSSNMSRTQLYYVNKLNQKNVFYLLDEEVDMMKKDK